MFGGIAVAGNLLCIAHPAARARLFLFDLEDRRLASFWGYSAADGGYSDAGGVAMDGSYNIYVADTRNDVVRRFSPFGQPVGAIGEPHIREPGAARRDRRGALDRPRGVAVFGDSVFVACGERWLVRGVQQFRRNGGDRLDPFRAFGESDGRFGAPRGIYAGREGVFVADTLHGVIQRFRLAGTYIGAIPTGLHPEQASRPIAVLPIGEQELVVVDDGDAPGVRHLTLDGQVISDELTSPETLEAPVDLASDAQGRVYVLDRGGERVLRFDEKLQFESVIVDLAEISLP